MRLPDINCSIPVARQTPVALPANAIEGPVRAMQRAASASGGQVVITAYGGIYRATIATNRSATVSLVASLGTDPGSVSRVSTAAIQADGAVVIVDASLTRLTTFPVRPLQPTAVLLRSPRETDSYYAAPGVLYAISTPASTTGYAPVTARVHVLRSGGRFKQLEMHFTTPSRHVPEVGGDVILAQRPLEADPLVHVTGDGRLLVNASDTLDLLWPDTAGHVLRLVGSGPRVRLTNHAMDSASLDYGQRMLLRAAEMVARQVRATAFVKRRDFQLIDELLESGALHVLVRRAGACTDRQIWHRVDRLGNVVATFGVATGNLPIDVRGDTLFMASLTDGVVGFSWIALADGASGAVRLSRSARSTS